MIAGANLLLKRPADAAVLYPVVSGLLKVASMRARPAPDGTH